MDKISFKSSRQIDAVAFFPQLEEADAPLLVMATSALEGNRWDGEVLLVDCLSGEALCRAGIDCGVSDVVWCGPDRTTLMFGGDDGDLRVIPVSMDVDFTFGATEKGEQSRVHEETITALSASQLDCNLVLSGSFDMSVKLWNVESMESCLKTFKGHVDLVWDVEWHPSISHVFASASQDQTVQMWDDRMKESARSIACPGASLSLAWHPQKQDILAIGLDNGSIIVQDIRANKEPLRVLKTHSGCVGALTYSPNHDDLLASGSDDTKINLISDTAGNDPRIRKTYTGHKDYVRSLDWNIGSHRMLATGSWDKTSFIFVPDV